MKNAGGGLRKLQEFFITEQISVAIFFGTFFDLGNAVKYRDVAMVKYHGEPNLFEDLLAHLQSELGLGSMDSAIEGIRFFPQRNLDIDILKIEASIRIFLHGYLTQTTNYQAEINRT